MPKPEKIMGFDPDYFEDRDGNIHRRPEGAPILVRLCGYAVLVRPGNAAHPSPQLLMTRPQWKKDRREFPGGGVENDEALVVGTGREVVEELGIDARLPKAAAPVAAFERSFVATWTPKPVFLHAVAFIFVARFPDGAGERVRLQEDEIDAMEWVDAHDDPPAGLHPMFVPHWPAIVREAMRIILI